MASDLDTQLALLGSLLVDAAPPVDVAEILGSTRQPVSDDGDADIVELDLGTIEGAPRRRRWPVAGLVLAGLSAAAAVTIIVVATNHDSPEQQGGPVASQPGGSADGSDPTATPPTVACARLTCPELDWLPLDRGVGEFFAGPESLGQPTMDEGLLDSLTRCAVMSADGEACEEIEGLAMVPLVTYGDPLAPSDSRIAVGTTFTRTSAMTYAEQARDQKSGGSPVATTVRGREAFSFQQSPGRVALVWEERQGVLVWLAVPVDRSSELATIAEGVRVLGEASRIPWRVIVPEPGVSYAAVDNNAAGFVVGHSGGQECVGFQALESCGTDIGARTFVRESMVASATPPEVAQVRVTWSNRTSALVSPEAKDGFTTRFVRISVPEPASAQLVEWLDSGGAVIASTVPSYSDTSFATATVAPPATD